jgi:hypothetical protein
MSYREPVDQRTLYEATKRAAEQHDKERTVNR